MSRSLQKYDVCTVQLREQQRETRELRNRMEQLEHELAQTAKQAALTKDQVIRRSLHAERVASETRKDAEECLHDMAAQVRCIVDLKLGPCEGHTCVKHRHMYRSAVRGAVATASSMCIRR